MLQKILSISTCLLLLCACQHGPNPPKNIFTEIDEFLTAAHLEDRFHGSISIGIQDTMLFEKQYGIANRDWNIPITAGTRFDIASVNKSFIAGLILIASEEDKINLDDRLVDLLKSHRYRGEFDEQITIHQLLTHTSGLADYNGVSKDLSANGFVKFKRSHFNNDEYVDFISQLEPRAKPGQLFYYSNFAYHLLCIILEDLYQLPFPDILQQKICIPLNLIHTFSSTANEEVKPQLAEGYDYDQESATWKRNNFIDLTLGRRIFSTSLDLLKWSRAISNGEILSNTSRTIMCQNHLSDITDELSYGYGWVICDKNTKSKMGDLEIDLSYRIHGGSTEGYKSMLIDIEQGRYTISFLSNSGQRTNEMNLAKNIVKLILAKDEK